MIVCVCGCVVCACVCVCVYIRAYVRVCEHYVCVYVRVLASSSGVYVRVCVYVCLFLLSVFFPDKHPPDFSIKEGNNIHVLIITPFTAKISCLMFIAL